MTNYKEGSKIINRIVQVLLLLLALMSALVSQQAREKKEDDGILKVISIREMSEKESARNTRDYFGATHIVRLRFEAPRDSSVFLYAPYCGKPIGYVLRRKLGQINWLAAPKGSDHSKSPGFRGIEVQTGACWLMMPARSALEWEVVAEPTIDEEEARSVFLRDSGNHDIRELISDWYSVPGAPSEARP